MTESILATTATDGTTTIYVEQDMGITTDKPALLGEIVRCRDCAYLEPVGGKGNPTHRCGLKFVNFESWNSALDGFCSWGKRRES